MFTTPCSHRMRIGNDHPQTLLNGDFLPLFLPDQVELKLRAGGLPRINIALPAGISRSFGVLHVEGIASYTNAIPFSLYIGARTSANGRVTTVVAINT